LTSCGASHRAPHTLSQNYALSPHAVSRGSPHHSPRHARTRALRHAPAAASALLVQERAAAPLSKESSSRIEGSEPLHGLRRRFLEEGSASSPRQEWDYLPTQCVTGLVVQASSPLFFDTEESTRDMTAMVTSADLGSAEVELTSDEANLVHIRAETILCCSPDLQFLVGRRPRGPSIGRHRRGGHRTPTQVEVLVAAAAKDNTTVRLVGVGDPREYQTAES